MLFISTITTVKVIYKENGGDKGLSPLDSVNNKFIIVCKHELVKSVKKKKIIGKHTNIFRNLYLQ